MCEESVPVPAGCVRSRDLLQVRVVARNCGANASCDLGAFAKRASLCPQDP